MGIIRVAVIAVLASVSALAWHQHASGQATVTIDFEEAEAGRSGSPGGVPITDDYAEVGVIFETPVTPLVIDAETIPARDGFARSGSVFVTTCYAEEFCTNRISIEMLEPLALVRMWVGSQQALSTPAAVVLEAFDSAGRQIDSDEVVLGPSAELIDVRIPIEVESPEALIARVELGWADLDSGLSGLAMDDLELVQFVPEPAIVGAPDPVELDGSNGTASGGVEFRNTGNVTLDIGDVVIEPAVGVFEIASETCSVDLQPGDACEVVIRFGSDEPGSFDASLLLVGFEGEVIGGVGLVAAGPESAQGEPTTPPETVDTDGSEDGSGDDGTSSGWLWWIGVGLIALVAVGTVALLRRHFRRRPPKTRVDVKTRPDDGEQQVVESGTPVVTLRTTMSLDDGTTTISEDGVSDT